MTRERVEVPRLPAGWSRVELPSSVTERFENRELVLYERDEVGVYLLPTVDHDAADRWQVGLVRGRDFDGKVPLQRRIEGRERAGEVAVAVMETYDECGEAATALES
jgi:hypothetical protein